MKQEVNSLWELGLNSIANSSDVYLGEHFIDLIKKDKTMEGVRKAVNDKIISNIRARAYLAPYIEAQSLVGHVRGSVDGVAFGGDRNHDDMAKQLKFTLLHPISSLDKYADTWNVAMQELTWTIRHCRVDFDGTYQAVYNVSGAAWLWEMRFSIKDTLDLRPHSNSSHKIDFKDSYNTVTSILGTVYHDLIGNTDKLFVHASWDEAGINFGKIHDW